MLTVHHLGKSQSERIVWLCEELAIPYELKRYARDALTILARADYKALHPIGAAPVITDGNVVRSSFSTHGQAKENISRETSLPRPTS
jgi:glutathione S-transferase